MDPKKGTAAMAVGCVLIFLFARSYPGGVVQEVSLFPVRAAVGGVVTLGFRIGDIFGSKSMARKMEDLEQENQQLRLQVAELQEDVRETDSLRAILRAKARAKGDTLPCRVISRAPSYWFHTLTIDVGKRDGVDDQTVVIDGKGVVGRVYHTDYLTSKVLLLSGRMEGLFSGVGAKVERTGDVGVVEGDNRSELRLAYLQAEAQLKPGDTVVTSGLGGVFPAGLPIGAVLSVVLDQDGLSKSAVVLPSADLSHLNLLLALLPPKEKPK